MFNPTGWRTSRLHIGGGGGQAGGKRLLINGMIPEGPLACLLLGNGAESVSWVHMGSAPHAQQNHGSFFPPLGLQAPHQYNGEGAQTEGTQGPVQVEHSMSLHMGTHSENVGAIGQINRIQLLPESLCQEVALPPLPSAF